MAAIPGTITIDEFQKNQKEGFLIVDTRPSKDFLNGFIPGSIHVPPHKDFITTTTPFLLRNQYFMLVTLPGEELQTAEKIYYLGFENLMGALEGGFEAWLSQNLPVDVIVSITPEEFDLEVRHGNLYLIDTRDPEAFEMEHVEDSHNFEPEVMYNNYDRIDDQITNCIYCANGSDSLTLISFLKFNGHHNLYHVEGGYGAIRNLDNIKIVKPGANKDIISKFRGKN